MPVNLPTIWHHKQYQILCSYVSYRFLLYPSTYSSTISQLTWIYTNDFILPVTLNVSWLRGVFSLQTTSALFWILPISSVASVGMTSHSVKKRHRMYKFSHWKVKRFHEKKGTWFHGLTTEFFFCLLADFNSNRAGKWSNRTGKVLNAAYTDANFLLLLWSAIKVYIREKKSY